MILTFIDAGCSGLEPSLDPLSSLDEHYLKASADTTANDFDIATNAPICVWILQPFGFRGSLKGFLQGFLIIGVPKPLNP